MAHNLDNSHPVYIRMTVTGLLEKTGTIAAMSDLIQHPDYTVKHSLWDFRQASMGLSIGDLGEIVGVLRLYKSKEKDFANKSALVIPGRLNAGMAKVYVSLSSVLPFDYKIFETIEAAKTFLETDTG